MTWFLTFKPLSTGFNDGNKTTAAAKLATSDIFQPQAAKKKMLLMVNASLNSLGKKKRSSSSIKININV